MLRRFRSENSPTNLFGTYMRDLRLGVDLSRRDLALLLGVSETVVESWENGSEVPHQNLSPKISKAFKIRESEWLDCLTFELISRAYQESDS